MLDAHHRTTDHTVRSTDHPRPAAHASAIRPGRHRPNPTPNLASNQPPLPTRTLQQARRPDGRVPEPVLITGRFVRGLAAPAADTVTATPTTAILGGAWTLTGFARDTTGHPIVLTVADWETAPAAAIGLVPLFAWHGLSTDPYRAAGTPAHQRITTTRIGTPVKAIDTLGSDVRQGPPVTGHQPDGALFDATLAASHLPSRIVATLPTATHTGSPAAAALLWGLAHPPAAQDEQAGLWFDGVDEHLAQRVH